MPSKTIIYTAVLFLSLVFIFGCDNGRDQQGAEQAMQNDDAEQKIIEVDCAFAEMGIDSGLAVAFVRFAADSAIILRNRQMPIIGKEAIGQSFGSPEGLLQWEPIFADVSGDLGYTFGRYQYNPGDTTLAGTRQGTGKTSYGYYVSIWKKIDGEWKYVLDTGISTPDREELPISKPTE